MKNKLCLSSGIINIALATATVPNVIIMFIFVAVCLLMSFSLFFLAAIPLFLICGVILLVAIAAVIANYITGVGTIVASMGGKKVTKVFSVISIIIDGLFIPSSIVFMLMGVMSVTSETNWLGIAIIITGVIAVGLAIAGLTVNCVFITKLTKALPAANQPHSTN